MLYPAHLKKLIALLTLLPGVGHKTAERYAFHLLRWKREQLGELASALQDISLKLSACHACGCLRECDACAFCDLERRQRGQLCIVSSAREVFQIESTGTYRGLYQVLGGLLSPLDGQGPEILGVERMNARIETLGITEVIIALDSTLEGDATSLFLREHLRPSTLKITRIAFGLPMGSTLEYVDGGTLARALSGRQTL